MTMAASSEDHVRLSAGEEEEEAQHDSSDQGDEDDDDEGSVKGEHDTDDDGDGDDDGGEEDDRNDADDGGEADKEDEQGGGGGGGDGDDEEQGANPNAGWADAMAKILKKNTPASKPSILVKSKQLDKIRVKEKQERLEQRDKTDKKRAWEMMCRVKPDIATDREAERTFQRTATRGVVQLFNAVRKHQNLVNDKVKEVGGSERKKAKLLSSVTKKDFIDVLRGKNMAGGKVVKAEKRTAAEDEKPSWSVLRDDFMMGAKMKDWDKQSDTEVEQAGAQNVGAEDSDSD